MALNLEMELDGLYFLPGFRPSSRSFRYHDRRRIRQSFLDFFKEKQHTIVPSASLLPQSPGLLFTNAGM
ncbi:MAG: hypothetical protein HC767_05140, partial [Akkermansiaceae bacterium]|nr:hypothetical protein [Akkermansiaceae bacterium]